MTTILAADVAGYSRLVSRNEEAAITALRTHRRELIEPLLVRFEGRVANTAGDSLLVEFGSIVNAVRFAITMQSGMRERNREVAEDQQVRFRIGINIGDVVVDGDDLLGDGVNIAARLEGLAEPDGICLSRSVRDQIRHLPDISLDDLGEIEVKNISRPVRAFRVRNADVPSPETPVTRPTKRWPVAMAGVAVAVIAVIAVLFWSGRIFEDSAAPSVKEAAGVGSELRPVMTVLPFDNLSADPEQEYFADGLTEDLTSALARIPGFLVTARNTAFSFKGKAIDARELGAQLGVRYVLEGSARKFGDRMRVNAQLIETEGGTHVWAESYDRPLHDIFIVQDEMVDRIVGSVASRLRRREGERAMSAKHETLAAYDLTARARLLFRRNNVESMTEARELLRLAIVQDPTYGPAYSKLAQVEMFFFTSRISDEYANPKTAKRVVEAAARGSALAPENASAHAVNGMALRLLGKYEEAAREAALARELAPNDPDVLAEIVAVLVGVGNYQDADETVRIAQALDPYINPLTVGALQGQALFALGKYKESLTAANYCLQRTPQDVRCHESKVRALGELGPPDAARNATAELLRLSPDYTIAEYRRRARKNRKDKAAIDRWAEGLRKAGVPD